VVEGINVEKVTNWLVERIPGIELPLSFTLIAGGHSNLTFRCEDGAGNAFVLRRPPLGHVLESAHDMGREHKIIDALKGSDVPVPANHGLCKDNAVNEADFYVMEFIDGLVLNDSVIASTLPGGSRIPIGEDVVDILCKLHAIDPDDVGLGDLGRKEEYLTRQLKRWTKQWEAARTHDIPHACTNWCNHCPRRFSFRQYDRRRGEGEINTGLGTLHLR
jgi:aminoglycoside phosphotransferase (APT) family kinase protein